MSHRSLRAVLRCAESLFIRFGSSEPAAMFKQHANEVNHASRHPHQQTSELLVLRGGGFPGIADQTKRAQLVDGMKVWLVKTDRQKGDQDAKQRADDGGAVCSPSQGQ